MRTTTDHTGRQVRILGTVHDGPYWEPEAWPCPHCGCTEWRRVAYVVARAQRIGSAFGTRSVKLIGSGHTTIRRIICRRCGSDRFRFGWPAYRRSQASDPTEPLHPIPMFRARDRVAERAARAARHRDRQSKARR